MPLHFEGLTKFPVQASVIQQRDADPSPTHDTMSSRWDEALMACMYDENARRYVDYLGARQ